MTKYFTINAEHEGCKFCSAHYGTEMYLIGVSDDDIAFFKAVMNEFTEEDFVYIVTFSLSEISIDYALKKKWR